MASRSTTPSLAQFLKAEGVAPQKIPRVVVTVDDLPRTASGKVKKYELVDQLPERPYFRTSQSSRTYVTVNFEMFAQGRPPRRASGW